MEQQYKVIPVKDIIDKESSQEINDSSVGKSTLHMQWLQFCNKNRIDEVGRKRLEEQHIIRISSVVPGYLDLIEEDCSCLRKLLLENNGSREVIKTLRKWIIERAHSIAAIGLELKSFLENGKTIGFEKMLHTLYVINDVLYNMQNATTFGPYTSLVQQVEKVPIVSLWLSIITPIMWSSYHQAENESQRERVTRLMKLWESKQFIDSHSYRLMCNAVLGEISPPTFPTPPLTSPYLLTNVLSVPNDHAGKSQYGFLSAPTSSANPEYTPSVILDITKLSVGQMMLTVKQFSKIVSQKYSPVDFSLIHGFVMDDTEPGRLDIRVDEFYHRINKIHESKHEKRHRSIESEWNNRSYDKEDGQKCKYPRKN